MIRNRIGEFETAYDPDSGKVTITAKPGALQFASLRRGPSGTPIQAEEVTIPMELLKEVVACWARGEILDRIYKTTADQILLGEV